LLFTFRVSVGARTFFPIQEMEVERRRAGSPLDFTFADFDMPVVVESIGNEIKAAAQQDAQLLPVRSRVLLGLHDPKRYHRRQLLRPPGFMLYGVGGG
jgi:hypothetical protein